MDRKKGIGKTFKIIWKMVILSTGATFLSRNPELTIPQPCLRSQMYEPHTDVRPSLSHAGIGLQKKLTQEVALGSENMSLSPLSLLSTSCTGPPVQQSVEGHISA